jgi:hypothetical protein
VNENLRLEMQAYVLKILVISQSINIINYNKLYKRIILNFSYNNEDRNEIKIHKL